MTMPIDWDDEVIRQYLTPESHQKSRAEFERTHIDIDKIKTEYLFPHPTNDEFVTQAEFRDAILKSTVTDDNRIFILRGETGSGKSQLCQWLEYQIGGVRDDGQDETHIALHVSRSETRIKDIVDILTEPIDVDIRVGNVEDLNPAKVADAMVRNLDAYAPTAFQELTKSEVEDLIADRPGNDLRGILEANLREYQNAVTSDEGNEIPDLIDEKDYRELALGAFGEARGADTIFPTLRGFLHDELSGKLNVGNFQEKLERISDAYVQADLRPVLICEDLTTFSVLKEQLLDHIFQLDSGHYDVVLGWTTGWEKDDLDKALGTSENTYTYMKDRAEGYLSTTDDNGQAYFLTEDVTVELARKYVSVIREESSTKASVDIPEEAFDHLYPFNAEFIRRAYEHLVQDGNERRTPRLLLIRIVRECLTSTAPPFEAIEGNPYVKQFPTPVPLDLPSELQRLAKWYGFPNAEQNMELPRGIADVFGTTIPNTNAVLNDGDPIVIQGKGGQPKQDFRLDQIAGTVEPGATLTVEVTLNGRPEANAEIEIDGSTVGVTDQDGRVDVDLPNEDTGVTISARKGSLSDELDVAIGIDSLTLSATPSRPDVGDEVTIEARFNGEPTSGVPIYRGEESVGTTGTDGTTSVVADDPPEMSISGEIEDVEDGLTLQVFEGSHPVDTDLSSEEVDQQRFEFEEWLKTGEEYPSSETLRAGAATVLEEWHEPTRLANANASTRGVDGIYYARGSDVPVSIQAVDERQGLSIELPFGTEYNEIYDPLLWCGISSENQLPYEERYELNYDLLRGWAADQVAQFREGMRDDIESCLPEDWTIEQFIVVAQYLLLNGANGTTELDRELVFEEFETPTPHPIRKRFSESDAFAEAYGNLTKSSSAPQRLAEGFFKLKETFVDDQRLSRAYEAVVDDLETYIDEAAEIDTSDLPDAYRIGTNRSSATTRLEPFLRRVKEYAQELSELESADLDHVTESIERIDQWFDKSHSVPELQQRYEKLYTALDTFDGVSASQWMPQKNQLEDTDNLHLAAFQREIESFRELESKDGPELVALLHEFERSRDERVEWDIYEAIGEMITQAESVDIPSAGEGLEAEIRRADEMGDVVELCSEITSLGGGN
jgi:hypothetical protein